MDIQKDIQDAIEKQLPAQVGEVLRKRLEQAEVDAKTVKTQANTIEGMSARIDRMDKLIEEKNAQLAQHGDLAKRETEVAARERDLKITLLEAQVIAANEKTQFAKEVALGLVRNTEFRKSVFENSNKQVPTAPGAYTMSQNESNSTTTTEGAA